MLPERFRAVPAGSVRLGARGSSSDHPGVFLVPRECLGGPGRLLPSPSDIRGAQRRPAAKQRLCTFWSQKCILKNSHIRNFHFRQNDSSMPAECPPSLCAPKRPNTVETSVAIAWVSSWLHGPVCVLSRKLQHNFDKLKNAVSKTRSFPTRRRLA